MVRQPIGGHHHCPLKGLPGGRFGRLPRMTVDDGGKIQSHHYESEARSENSDTIRRIETNLTAPYRLVESFWAASEMLSYRVDALVSIWLIAGGQHANLDTRGARRTHR